MISRSPIILALLVAATAAWAEPNAAQKIIFDQFAAQAKSGDPAFKGFSAERGRDFFLGQHTGGKPDTASCTSCHTKDLTKPGQTRAGKAIEPMAASVNPKRFTDAAEVEKWFRRNCGDVLGRECTLTEKGDVLAFLLSQ
ncbi:MAG: DUF1924 domain-containing protein [Hyphomicrobium sp.]|nr:DUF1924 domain-containing protein [Hyphomicrobium sp.]